MTNHDLWINTLGEVGRGEALVRYPSTDLIHALFKGPPTEEQYERLWDMIVLSFLAPNEITLYEKWKEVTRHVLGVEGSFTAEGGGTYGFSCYVNKGRVWLAGEPCMPSSDTPAWAAIEATAATTPGAVLEALTEGYGLVSAPDVLDRQASLAIDITDRTTNDVRRLANRLAGVLSHAQALGNGLCDDQEGR